MTAYGKRCIEELVGGIADAGITIVSGLALGVDTYAHKVAFDHGAQTICVLGNGIDTVYPSHNQKFAEYLIAEKKGVILSEYFPGTSPIPEYFPMRNRIVAGLSKATLIIEAAEKSGSLITASLALEQGREVFAVPGEIFAKNAQGTNRLLERGEAHPALSASQILDVLGFEQIAKQKKAKDILTPTGIENDILELFGTEHRVHIDDLIRASHLPAPLLNSNISLMEIRGLIRHEGNQMYVKNI